MIVGHARFSHFLEAIGSGRFSSSHGGLVRAALISANFASSRYLRLMGLFDFSDRGVGLVRAVCPQVISGPGFCLIVRDLAFRSSGGGVGRFIEGCRGRHGWGLWRL